MSFPAVRPLTACFFYLLARSALSGNAPSHRDLRKKKNLAKEKNYPSLSGNSKGLSAKPGSLFGVLSSH